MKEKNKRLEYIDLAKGLGILLVVLGHMNLIISDDDEAGRAVVHIIYSFHMPLFFVLTGFVQGHLARQRAAEGKIHRISPKRLFLRLMVPYFIWSAVYMIAQYLTDRSDAEKLWDMAKAAVFMCGSAPLWFLNALFFSELIFGALRYSLGINERKIMAGAAVLSVMASRLYNENMPELEQVPRYLTIAACRLLPSVFFVAFGCYLYGLLGKRSRRGDLRRGAGLAALLTVMVTVYSPGVNMHIFRFGDILYFFMTGAIGSAAVILICRGLPEGLKGLSLLGKSSMDIMVLHYTPMPFIPLSAALIERLMGKPYFVFVYVVTLVMVCPLAIGLSFLKTAWVKRGSE